MSTRARKYRAMNMLATTPSSSVAIVHRAIPALRSDRAQESVNRWSIRTGGRDPIVPLADRIDRPAYGVCPAANAGLQFEVQEI